MAGTRTQGDGDGTDYDLMKQMAKGFDDVLKRGATAGGKKLLGLGLQYALKYAGYESPDEKEKKALAEALQQIQSQLRVIDQKLEVLTDGIEDLTKDVKKGFLQQQYADLYKMFVVFKGDVDTAAGHLSDVITYARSGNVDAAKMKTNLRNLAQDYRAVEANVQHVADYFGADPFPESQNVVEAWADLCAAALESGSGRTVWQWFASIESQMLQGVYVLFRGCNFMVNLIAADDLIRSADPDYPSPVISTGKPSAEAARDQVGDWGRKLFSPITESYRGSVVRFLLSRYDPEAPGPTPSFLNDELLNYVTTRTDLGAWLISNTDLEASTPGLAVRKLTRPTLADAGVELTPGGFPKAKAERREPPAKYLGSLLPYWFKCIDFRPESCEMVAFEDSDVRTVEATWPWDGRAMEPGAAIPVEGCRQDVVPQFYHRNTLSVAEGEDARPDNPDVVWFGQVTDAHDLLQNFLFSNGPAGNSRYWTWDDDDFRQKRRLPIMNRDSPHAFGASPYSGEFVAVLLSMTSSKTYRWDAQIVREIRYPGGVKRCPDRCQLLMKADYDVHVDNWKHAMQGEPTYVRLYLRSGYAEDQYHNDAVDRPDPYEYYYRKFGSDSTLQDEPMSFWSESNDGSDRPASQRNPVYLDLIPGSGMQLAWRMRLSVDSNHDPYTNKVTPVVSASSKVRIHWVRLAWKQPKFAS